MRQALLLNATYEPIRVIPVRRAVVLVMMKKAEVITETGDVFRSESKVVPVPSVIRLHKVAQIPYVARAKLSKNALRARDNDLCGYCAGRGENIDHVLPRSRGGKHVWENVVWSCVPCNAKKADRTPAEAGMKLLVKPYAPKDRVWIVLSVGRLAPSPDWEPYLAMAH